MVGGDGGRVDPTASSAQHLDDARSPSRLAALLLLVVVVVSSSSDDTEEGGAVMT